MGRIITLGSTFLALAASASALTIILDFNEPAQANTTDIFGNVVQTFDVTSFGFVEADRAMIQNAIFNAVVTDYRGIFTDAQNALSPLPDGFELDIDFEIGDFGVAPSNGDTEFYYTQIGTRVSGPHNGLGVAGTNSARDAAGNPHAINGRMVGSIFANNINGLSGVGTQLSSGLISPTTHAIAGTLSHEIGHAVSLAHLNVAASLTPSGLNPLMGTGAIDLPNAARIVDREFAISGFNAQAGGAAQAHIAQLMGSIGTRALGVAVPEPSTALPLLLLMGLMALRRIRG